MAVTIIKIVSSSLKKCVLKNEVRSGMQSSVSLPIGDATSGGILKDDNEVRSLTKDMSGSNTQLMFELWFN